MNAQKSYAFIIAVVFLFMGVQFLFFKGGYMAYDEMIYSELAHKIVHGGFSTIENLFAFRWTVVFPLAFLYRIFGTGDFSNFLFTAIP